MDTSIAQVDDLRNVDPTEELPIFNNFENATFAFYPNTTEITRGVDDLILHFLFSYENGSFISDANIYYNITNPSYNLIFERNLTVSESTLFNDTVIWSTFNSQPEGNYTLTAVANSTTTDIYTAHSSFNLTVLETGRVRMYFPINPSILSRNINNNVRVFIVNIGGSTVTNVSIINIEKTGTVGSVDTYIGFGELVIGEGEIVERIITFNPETYLYKKYSFTFSYRTIDEPGTQIIGSSDPLEIIIPPYIQVSTPTVPTNTTVGDVFIITYEVTNNEGETLYILPSVRCNEIEFEEDLFTTSVRIVPGHHELEIEGTPVQDATTTVLFSVDLEWTTIGENKWYSLLVPTVIQTIRIYPKEAISGWLNPAFIYSMIFVVMFAGIAYFSRDMIKGLTKRVRQPSTRHFPEVNYILDTVILDGSNIAWEEKSMSDKPKISNIESMINRLSQANFKKIVTVADAALRYQIDNQRRLDKLVKDGAVKMLPARVDGDKFILRLAEEENAMIVSNDMFKEFREISPWIDQRRIPYTILDGEVYLHPTAAKTTEDLKIPEEFRDSIANDDS
jgi:hypothetical protein